MIWHTRHMGMEADTSFGPLNTYVVLWVTMMAAMMLPSALPMVLLFHLISRETRKRGAVAVPTWVFAGTYLAVWTLFGLLAYFLSQAIAALQIGFLPLAARGDYVAGALVCAAGAYELTPLKSACLRHCRAPIHYLLGGWKPGILGAIQMAIGHGVYCVGCCLGLMLVLFALGVMSLFWMAVVSAVIVIQKVFPFGDRTPRIVAVALVILGLVVAVAPFGGVASRVPGIQSGVASALTW